MPGGKDAGTLRVHGYGGGGGGGLLGEHVVGLASFVLRFSRVLFWDELGDLGFDAGGRGFG